MQTGTVDHQTLAARLLQQNSIDDPFTGQAAPAAVQAGSKLWPDPSRWQSLSLKYVTEQGNRRIEEYVFTGVPGYALTEMGVDLPVAIVFEKQAEGSVARIYSAHELVANRGPILEVNPDIVSTRGAGDIFVEYFSALHDADLERTIATFETDGYMRHSNGKSYVGHEALRTAFTKFFATGGIKLRYCNKTDGGPITALECYMPSGRPACAIYHRGTHGLVEAARLYL
ncbi:MAG: hypothetical protein QM808_17465 [Steroidobacteraceae bacterium]